MQRYIPDRAALDSLRAVLDYDKRPKGAHGRALLADLPGLNLLKGDRLEPSVLLPDVGALDDWVSGGKTLSWWRPGAETLCRHRNPLLTSGLCGLQTCMQVDWLHTLSLGVFQDYLASLVAYLFYDVGIYASQGTSGGILQASVQQLEHELFRWYAAERQQGHSHTEVQRLKASMFGSPDEPVCHLHGSETNGFLKFGVHLLGVHGITGPWLTAGRALLQVYELIKAHPHNMQPAAIQETESTDDGSVFS